MHAAVLVHGLLIGLSYGARRAPSTAASSSSSAQWKAHLRDDLLLKGCRAQRRLADAQGRLHVRRLPSRCLQFATGPCSLHRHFLMPVACYRRYHPQVSPMPHVRRHGRTDRTRALFRVSERFTHLRHLLPVRNGIAPGAPWTGRTSAASPVAAATAAPARRPPAPGGAARAPDTGENLIISAPVAQGCCGHCDLLLRCHMLIEHHLPSKIMFSAHYKGTSDSNASETDVSRYVMTHQALRRRKLESNILCVGDHVSTEGLRGREHDVSRSVVAHQTQAEGEVARRRHQPRRAQQHLHQRVHQRPQLLPPAQRGPCQAPGNRA